MQVVEQVQVRHKQDNKSFAHPAICRTLLSKGRLNLISYGVHSFSQGMGTGEPILSTMLMKMVTKGYHFETIYRMTRDQGLSGLNPGAHDNQSSSLPIPRAILG